MKNFDKYDLGSNIYHNADIREYTFDKDNSHMNNSISPERKLIKKNNYTLLACIYATALIAI